MLPFTATYGRVAGLVEQGLYVLALLLDVIALGLLFGAVALGRKKQSPRMKALFRWRGRVR